MSDDLPRTFKIATFWLVLGALVFVAIQWQLHRQRQTSFHAEGSLVAIAVGRDGHYHWPGRLNGRKVDFLIDTGATTTALPSGLAHELGLESEGEMRSHTAGGPVTGQIVRADLRLDGGVRIERLRMASLAGLEDEPLLGMDVLGRLHLEQGDGVLRIDLRPR